MRGRIFFLLHPTHNHAPQDAFRVPLGGPQLLQQAVTYVPLAGLGVDRGVALAFALVAHLQVEERGRSHFTSTTFFLCLNQTTWDKIKVVDWWREQFLGAFECMDINVGIDKLYSV